MKDNLDEKLKQIRLSAARTNENMPGILDSNDLMKPSGPNTAIFTALGSKASPEPEQDPTSIANGHSKEELTSAIVQTLQN